MEEWLETNMMRLQQFPGVPNLPGPDCYLELLLMKPTGPGTKPIFVSNILWNSVLENCHDDSDAK